MIRLWVLKIALVSGCTSYQALNQGKVPATVLVFKVTNNAVSS